MVLYRAYKKTRSLPQGFIVQSKERTVQNSLDTENVYYLLENHKQMDTTQILNRDMVTKDYFSFYSCRVIYWVGI